jgi:type I restriction enzyme, S subunit
VDDLIEKHSFLVEKTRKEMSLLFGKLSQRSAKEKVKNLIKFVKGRKPDFSGDIGQSYLTIDALISGTENVLSCTGVQCDQNDVMMVMDGASSGKVFIGRKGYVGSTLAKIESSISPALLFLFLSLKEAAIMGNTSGSAIPHADKGFIGDFEMPIITDKIGIQTLEKEMKYMIKINREKSILEKEKEILLKRYF